MKSRFSSVDIKVIVKELQRFRGLRVVNIYDTDNKTYLIKLSKPEEKVMILIESGIRIHSTEFQWPKNVFPSGFSMKMRKHLKGRRLEKLTQLGIDRIVDFQFGSNEAAYHVIVELYDRGNIILADYEYLILNILRPRTDESQEVRFAVREKYPIDVIKQHEPFSPEKIKTAIELAKDGDSLKKVLVPLLEYGPAITEHCILQAGFELNFKFGKNFNFSEEDFQRLFAVFTEAEELLSSLGAKTKAGYIIQKLESRPNTKDGEPKELLTYDEFHPLLLLQHEKKTHQKFDSFDKAVDEYFSKQEAQKLDVKVLQQERLALKKLENVKKDHEKRVQLLQKEQDLDTVKGQLIEMNLTLVDQAIMVVQSALANQIDWTEIANLVKQAQSEGDPVASTIKKLKLDTNHITLLLKNPYGDEEMDQTETVDIDLSLTAYGNSKKYFDKKKQAAKKEKKTIDASKKALKSAERKTKQTLKDVATSATINKTRKTYWFEKFLWFISSENYLVIGGRDQQQNELIVKRHLRPGDVYVHADLHGASSVIIKNSTSFDETSLLKEIACGLSAKEIHSLAETLGFPNAEFVRIENQYPQDLLTKLSEILKWKNLRETQSTVKLLVESLQEIGRFDLAELLKQKSAVPPKTLNEAGTMAICNSVAWDAKVVTSAWWVYHDQVSKTAPTGEYLTTGSFMIRGKKNYLPPSYLIYGFGFLFKLEDGSVFRHAGERRVREIKDPVSPTIGESLDPADEDTSLDEVDEDEAAENSSTDVSEEENRDEQIPDDSSISESGNCASTCANSSDSKDDASSQRSDVQDDSIFPDTAINLTFVGDKLQLQRAMSSSNTEEQVTAEDGASSQATDDKVLRKSAKLSAKQKREMKKKKRDQPVQDSLDDSCSSHPRDNSKQHDQANEGSENKASQQQKYQKRGQKTKLKKIREKYKDQDEEERQLRMKILGSIGSAKEEKRKGKKRKDATMVSKQGSKTGGPTKPVQPGGQQVKAEGKPDSMPALLLDNPMNDAESKPGSDMKSEIEDADDDNLDEAEDGMQPAKDYQILDTLTSCPVPDDELLYAVPMMAPYNTLINYKFKVKLLPGSTKRGKAAKTSMNIFIHDKSASSREKDLIRLLKDVDISRNIPGKVKLAASNLPKKKQK